MPGYTGGDAGDTGLGLGMVLGYGNTPAAVGVCVEAVKVVDLPSISGFGGTAAAAVDAAP